MTLTYDFFHYLFPVILLLYFLRMHHVDNDTNITGNNGDTSTQTNTRRTFVNMTLVTRATPVTRDTQVKQ